MARRCEIDRETIRFYVAAVANTEMEHMRSYLVRGRALADWTVDELDAAWDDAFSPLDRHRDPGRVVKFSDLRAEMRLRGLKPLIDPIASDIERLEERLRERSTANDRALIVEIARRFKEQLAAPRH